MERRADRLPAVEYDPGTVLIVTDVQNDFADAKGSLYVRGGEEVVTGVNAEIVRALAAGATVVYTQDWHPTSTPHFQKDGGIWPVHCVMGTWGAEFHPRLLVAGPTVRKGSNGEDGYSGFTMRHPVTQETMPTELAIQLEWAGAKQIVVTGLALDYCVKATALDGHALGYPTTVPLGLTAAVDLNEGDGAQAAAELAASGIEILES
jgi:nicotinamidase/pyrazinamidase